MDQVITLEAQHEMHRDDDTGEDFMKGVTLILSPDNQISSHVPEEELCKVIRWKITEQVYGPEPEAGDQVSISSAQPDHSQHNDDSDSVVSIMKGVHEGEVSTHETQLEHPQ